MIEALLKQRILLLDGAMGTALQARNLTPEDFGGEAYDGCNENLVLTRPDVIQSIHEEYLAAGADIVETNTFGATSMVLGDYGLENKVNEINVKAVELARAACDKYSTADKPRFVAGAMGPTTKSLSVTGGITFDEMADLFREQAEALITAGADYLLLETTLDTLNIKAGYIGILQAFESTGKPLPIAVSGTIETMGTMLAGQGVEALYASIEHMDLLYIGLNCATGPEFMRDHIRTLASISKFPVAVVPNAGIPDADGNYPETPDMLAATLSQFCDEGWINLLGGCCGTTISHVERLSLLAKKNSPRKVLNEAISRISGIDPLILEDDGRPYIVGERSNVIGSRAFKRLIENNQFDEASEIARKQVKAGAHIVDICLSNPDRDEKADIEVFLDKVNRIVKVPIMVDSQDPEVVEAAFKRIQGKCILNSVNLEDGEEAFEALLPLVKRYGAAVVVGCIRGEMAVTAADKLDVAIESHRLITEKYGIDETDIIFDPLVFPCGTGDENYFGSGKETIEGVRLIKDHFPHCKTTLGISNVSFGLPGAGREVLNSVFVYHCTKAGLDTAIVNSEKMVRFSQISDEEKQLCDDLLWYRTDNGNDPVANFAAYFRDKVVETVEVDRSTLSLDEKFEINIVQGTKEFLIENLDEALKTLAPLSVINGPLMRAMDIVGKLFNDNELIVAEVLQSAEVMKAAVAYLETFMDKNDSSARGKLLLATVKGDVHDIGKNLVSIILGNNGFDVIDLGIKCPPEVLIEAVKTHKPDVIGLSGLLVKSAQQMVITAKDLKQVGIDTPILVGGAALTDTFTALKIAPEYAGPVVYCKDAMSGLDVVNQLMDPSDRETFLRDLSAHQASLSTASSDKKAPKSRPIEAPLDLRFDQLTAKAPDFDTHVVSPPLDEVWPLLNQQMLMGTHMGLKGNLKKLLANGDEKAVRLAETIDRVKADIIAGGHLKAKGMFQFFKCRRDGNAVVILDSKTETETHRFTFPRQGGGKQLCLSDFIRPDGIDTVCFFVGTSGFEIVDYARELKEAGQFVDAHAAASIGLEVAEGMAEYLHRAIRSAWGIADAPNTTPDDLLKMKYQGKRYSFGYPACPSLDDQNGIWSLMSPDEHIGVELSEDCMMHPEGSVSAMVFHHPQAIYFTVREADQ